MRYWVFTSKPEHFKMSEALVPGETLDWPTFARFKFEVGDLVFFYASSPILQMIGKLEIEEIGLPFSEINPRNELRKWPKHHSRIPWMRLRVLQSAPVPFKPLQRGSLYYHTEFKPSPYPKLLHEGEREYVMRAFDEAMTYRADMVRYEDGVNPDALARVTRGEILQAAVGRLKGGFIESLYYSKAEGTLTVEVVSNGGETRTVDTITSERDNEGIIDRLKFTFGEVIRAKWDYEKTNDRLSGVRLDIDDTYMLMHFDGADIEILAKTLRID